MMKNEIKYAATMHYEWHPTREGVYAIHVRFPDLLKIGLPAFTVGNDPEDAVAAAKEVLEMMVEYAAEIGSDLPEPTPLEKINVDRGLENSGEPFRIEIDYIALEN